MDGMKRPDLNRLAKVLKVKKVRRFKKDELINHLIEHFPAEDLQKILNVPLWKRLREYLPHIYGIFIIIALICVFLFFNFSIKKKSHNVAEDYYLKGNVHFNKNQPDYQQALEAYLEAARLKPGNTKYLNSIGLAYLELANYNKAIGYFEKALALDTGAHGDRHPHIASWLNNLGEAWRELGNYQKAIGYYEKALAIFEKTYGKEHPQVAWVICNLGETFRLLGNYQKAIGYFEKALAIDRKTYGEEHPDVAEVWNNLGVAWDSLGNFQKAIRYYQKALTIYEKMLGTQHPHTKVVKENLAEAEKMRSEEEKKKEKK